MFSEATHHSHPLGRRRDGNLPLEHVHCVGQRLPAVPAQFHVEVKATGNDVGVIVDQPWQHTLPMKVDYPGDRARRRHHLVVAAHSSESTVFDRHGAGVRIAPIEGCEPAIFENEIGGRVFRHFVSRSSVWLASTSTWDVGGFAQGSWPNTWG